jgi:hypothetical protein
MGDETQQLEHVDSTDDEMPEEEKQPVAYLKVLKQRGVAETTNLVFEGENIVGRESSCNIWIANKALSKQHACIEASSDLHTIKDLASKNKTHRGKVALKPEVCYELTSGCELSFAGVKCEYHLGVPPAKSLSGDETASEVENEVDNKPNSLLTITTDSPTSSTTVNDKTAVSPSLTTNTQQEITTPKSPDTHRNSPVLSNILVSEIPMRSSDLIHQEIEQTVILPADSPDDEEMDNHRSPSVILESDDGTRGCGQAIEPTLILNVSLSDEGEEGGERYTKEDNGAGFGLEQTQAYFVSQTSQSSSTATAEAGSPPPTTDNEPTLAYNLVEDDESKSNEECEQTQAYNLNPENEENNEENDETIVSKDSDIMSDGRDEAVEEKPVESESRVESEVTTVKENRNSEGLSMNSQNTVTTRSGRNTKAPRRVFFSSTLIDEPTEKESQMPLISGVFTSMKPLRPVLSLNRVQIGESVSSKMCELSGELVDGDHDLPVMKASRKRACVLEDSEDEEKDGGMDNEVKLDREEVEGCVSLSQQKSGGGRARGGKRKLSGRGQGKGRRRNQVSTVREPSEPSADPEEGRAESLSLTPETDISDSPATISKAVRASAQKARCGSQQQTKLSLPPSIETPTDISQSPSLTPSVTTNSNSTVDSSPGPRRRGRKRETSSTAADIEVSSTPPSAKKQRLSARQSLKQPGDKVAASPKILFTGMRYKQGEKVMSGLSAYPCVCRVCVPACLPVCLSV